MAGARKEELRPLADEERRHLEKISRSRAETAYRVAGATALLAVAEGVSFMEAARRAGRRSPDSVAHLVWRFNDEGLDALNLRHGGGRKSKYGLTEHEKIMALARSKPTPEQDGTSTWSITLLQSALQQRGMPGVSRKIIWQAMHRGGLTWQKNRTWVDTGTVIRQRKDGPVQVTDVDTDAKKNSSRKRI